MSSILDVRQNLTFNAKLSNYRLRKYYTLSNSGGKETYAEFKVATVNNTLKFTLGKDMSFKARDADNYKTLSMPISYAKTLFSLILAKLESSNKFITCTFKLFSYDNVKGNTTKTSSEAGSISISRTTSHYYITIDFKDFDKIVFDILPTFAPISITVDGKEDDMAEISFNAVKNYFQSFIYELNIIEKAMKEALSTKEVTMTKGADEIGFKRTYNKKNSDA